MRRVNFRDDVLWSIAYRIGLDPAKEFLSDQANALAVYINSWVRRLWDVADWPEWTVTAQYAPSAHIVLWDQVPSTLTVPQSAGPPEPIPTPPLIGRVLKVYLVDPDTTWAPVDTPFRLNDRGIHCGFEHGPTVWVKFLPRCPQFTAKVWDSARTYEINELTYSPGAGECYKSKTSNNQGHDPATAGGGFPLPSLQTQETAGAPDNPGLAATAKIMDVFAALPAATNGAGTIPDPPPAGVIFTFEVRQADGISVLTNVAHIADGTESLLAIFTDLENQLSSSLPSFTVTLITSPSLSIRLEDASDFIVFLGTVTTAAGPVFPLAVVQVQKYVVASAAVAGYGQQFRFPLTPDQVVPGAAYQLTFTTGNSAQHTAFYTALATDSAQQILSGLIDAMIALQGADSFFTGVQSTLDTLSPAGIFTIDKTLGQVSLHPSIIPPGSSFWELVPFPFALVDQVVRGAYADVMKEEGQSDKATAEETAVPTETQVRAGAQSSEQYDPLSDQQKPKSRYAIK